jgi:hypothetical protein
MRNYCSGATDPGAAMKQQRFGHGAKLLLDISQLLLRQRWIGMIRHRHMCHYKSCYPIAFKQSARHRSVQRWCSSFRRQRIERAPASRADCIQFVTDAAATGWFLP